MSENVATGGAHCATAELTVSSIYCESGTLEQKCIGTAALFASTCALNDRVSLKAERKHEQEDVAIITTLPGQKWLKFWVFLRIKAGSLGTLKSRRDDVLSGGMQQIIC